MKKYKYGIIIGRFQPLCLNHIDLIKQAKKYCKKLIILIGRPNYIAANRELSYKDFIKYTSKYPLNYNEVLKSLESVPVKTLYVDPLEDILNPNHYEEYIINNLYVYNTSIKDFIFLGENPDTYKCFSRIKFKVLPNRVGYHATDIRNELISQGKSDKIACKLTKDQLNRVILSQKLSNFLENECRRL